LSDRVVSTTDSISERSGAAVNSIATLPPEKNSTPESPPNHPTSEVMGLTISQLIGKLGKTRQAIESARDKGTLREWGYRAEKKNARNWLYWAVDAG
jgi:hypothetical protein